MKKFDPTNHINNLLDDPYYEKLILIRNAIALRIDKYFQGLKAPRVDLYMVTGSVSSPMGKGSDSAPWPIQMGDFNTNLVDSAQFGMEPLVQRNFDIVYCYLPSFRGETPDAQHLSQFYHCEAEMKGSLEECIAVVDGLIQFLLGLLNDEDFCALLPESRVSLLKTVLKNPIERIDFKEACNLLDDDQTFIEKTAYGRRINRVGELELSKRFKDNSAIFWLTGFDRDIVPFYQKPDQTNPDKVLNADLIVPPLGQYGFAGELLGAGQRQDNVDEILESIRRQEISNVDDYKWYIDLRRRHNYHQTSGFGLGIERFISWLVGTEDIASAAIFPVMSNVRTEY